MWPYSQYSRIDFNFCPSSKDLLPKPFQELMIEKSSPILNYYPLEFRTDLNGKKNDWEAVVLIPFIDEVSS